MTLSPREAAGLLSRHGLSPRKALGQHFVVDPNTVRRIARLAGVGPGDRVVEIGAGLGSLTLALLETGAAVTAVEVDAGLVAVLEEVAAPAGARVVAGDAMALDWPSLLGDDGAWTLVANLPYNVASPLVADLLDGVPAIGRMLVMVQREVADRLVARPGSPAAGALSVKVAYWATAAVVGRVPPTVFLPQPRVESALVSLDRRPAPLVDPGEVPPEALFALVRRAFAGRRKMLRRSLADVVPADAFEQAGVAPTARAEDLDVAAWGRLARWAWSAGSAPPQS